MDTDPVESPPGLVGPDLFSLSALAPLTGDLNRWRGGDPGEETRTPLLPVPKALPPGDAPPSSSPETLVSLWRL